MLPQLIINGIIVGCVYALMALGLGLTYRTCRFLNFSYAAIFTLSAYIAAYLSPYCFGAPWLAAGAAAMIAASVAGALHLTVFTWPARNTANPQTLLLISLGVLISLQGMIALVCGSETSIFPGREYLPPHEVWGVRMTAHQVRLVITGVSVIVALHVIDSRTMFGVYYRAIASDRQLARVVGVKVGALSALGVLIAGGIVGLGGVLWGYEVGMTPTMGFSPLLVATVAVLIGGNRVVGHAVAAVVLGVIQQVAVYALPAEWQDALVFLILIVVCAFAPTRQSERFEFSGAT